LWDYIVLEDREEAVFENYSIHNKYPITDIEQGLRNNNVTISLHWEVVPYFGFMQKMRAPNVVSMVLPAKYTPLEH
jgi:hypothetical protein